LLFAFAGLHPLVELTQQLRRGLDECQVESENRATPSKQLLLSWLSPFRAPSVLSISTFRLLALGDVQASNSTWGVWPMVIVSGRKQKS